MSGSVAAVPAPTRRRREVQRLVVASLRLALDEPFEPARAAERLARLAAARPSCLARAAWRLRPLPGQRQGWISQRARQILELARELAGG